MKMRNRLSLALLLILITILLLAIGNKTEYSVTVSDFLSAYTLSLAIYALEAWREQKNKRIFYQNTE
ncbi:hypothetical protein CWI77_10385 [Pseudidiomarina planktonica]|nr:hypothetical protein CWI77_10385 [Pseudidiomarina planktonica]